MDYQIDSHQEWREKKNKVLRVIRKSRKAYMVEYFCGFFLLLFPLLLEYVQDIEIPSVVRYFIAGMALLAFLSAELSRSILRYKITPSKIVMIYGWVKQNKKNVYFHPLSYIPDFSIKQTRLQRLLRYGTVSFRGGGADEQAFEIKDVDNPHEIMRIIEEMIDLNKSMESKRK